MPGITGFITVNNRQDSQAMLDRMVGCMIHEPFYSSGTLMPEKFRVAIGWVCDSGSFSDCQPIWNENKDVCLVFAGESFGHQPEVDQLRARGHSFASDNASCLVHLYEEMGAGFFEKLNGVFSGMLIDLRQNKAILFNDRYGLNRIYCHEAADGFYFASEAKALLQAVPQLRRLEMQGLGELLTLGCVLQNRTLFSGISLLPPGSIWTFTPERPPHKETYFSKEKWESQERLSERDYYEKLKATFVRILPRYLKKTEPAAMSLTGGLDSRIIMAWAECEPSQLPCYSHSGVFHECADATIARRVARICHQTHQTITVGGKFFSEFPTLASQTVYITDGAMDVSGSAGLYVNRIARKEIAPVRMTGNYGSEILRRNIAFKPRSLNQSLFDATFVSHLNNGATRYAEEAKGDDLSFIAFKQVPWHHYSRFALEQSQLTVRSPYLDNELVALAYEAPPELDVNRQLAARLIAEGNPALAAFPTDRGPLGRNGFLGKIREKFQEFTFKAEYAYDYGMPQWLTNLDRVLRPLHLERLFLGRHKYYHFRFWYRNELAPYVKEVLLDDRTLSRPYLNRQSVARMVNAHVTGTGNYTSEIHMLLSSELIQRQLIEQR